MSKNNSTSFTKQNQKEKLSRLNQLTNSNGSVLVWEKGSKARESFSIQSFDKDNFILNIKSVTSTNLNNKTVLYSFSINGVGYFGQGQLKGSDKTFLALDCSEDLFKNERRASYRLLTFPHHKVYAHLPINLDKASTSNVVNIQTGISQTKLFKNFLDIVGDNDSTKVKTGFAKFRVLDISVTGLAFQISEMEKSYLPENNKLSELYLDFNSGELVIKNPIIVYVIPLITKAGKAYKVGIHFADFDINVDEFLGKKINDALRDFESEFEDFI